MLVADVMTTEVYTCSEDATARDALAVMWERDVGVLPIVSDDEQVIGLVTDRDLAMAGLIRGAPPHLIPVVDVTSGVVWSVGPQDTLEQAERVMEEHKVRRVPVMKGPILVGMVTLSDLVHARADGKTAKATRTFAAITKPRIGAEPIA